MVIAAIWKWFLGTTLGRWIVGIGAVAAALAVALYVAFRKGKHAQATADQAKDAAANAQQEQEVAQAVQRSADAVKETNDEIAKMPEAGTQRVGDAAPDSAAGWLRSNANRDQAGS